MAQITATVDGGSGSITVELASSAPGDETHKVTIPATVTDATITAVFEPGTLQAIVRPDINGTGALTCAKYQTAGDTDEVGQTVSLTDSQDNYIVGLTSPNIGRAVFTLATGNTLSYVWIREGYAAFAMRSRVS